jgi:hypothetical protein
MDDLERKKVEELAKTILPEFEQKLHATGWTLEKDEVFFFGFFSEQSMSSLFIRSVKDFEKTKFIFIFLSCHIIKFKVCITS